MNGFTNGTRSGIRIDSHLKSIASARPRGPDPDSGLFRRHVNRFPAGVQADKGNIFEASLIQLAGRMVLLHFSNGQMKIMMLFIVYTFLLIISSSDG